MRYRLKRNKYHILTYIGIAVFLIVTAVWAAQTDILGSLKITATGDSETYQFSVYNSSGTRVFSVDAYGNVYGKNVNYAVTSHVIVQSENWTLSAAEQATTYLIISSGESVGTGGVNKPNVYGPSTAGRTYCVRNGSNCSVQVLVLGQTGITVASTKTACVFSDGTDYRRLTADATH